jgi:hypothetical protein
LNERDVSTPTIMLALPVVVSVGAPNVMPGLDPGTRFTSISGYFSMTYSGTDGWIMPAMAMLEKLPVCHC